MSEIIKLRYNKTRGIRCSIIWFPLLEDVKNNAHKILAHQKNAMKRGKDHGKKTMKIIAAVAASDGLDYACA
jgi:hypothetical protein